MITLSLTPREVAGKLVKHVRQAGNVPGVLYGHGIAPRSVLVPYHEFANIYSQVGESTLINVTIADSTPVKALIQDVQVDPLTGRPSHIDFHQVRMDEKLTVDIPLKFIGESPAVKGLGGILMKNLDHLKVECLPDALVHEIEVDISSLVEFNRGLEVKDIFIPSGIKVLTNSNEIVTIVTAPRSEAELAALKTEVKEDVSAVAKVEKSAGGETAVEDKQ